jgi:hypothetical protein
VAIILIQRSCDKIEKAGDTTEVKTDTIYKHVYDTITKEVTVYKKQYVHINKPEYYPGETIDTCKARFQNLLKEHLVRTIYSDTIKLDSIGTLVIQDTVWINKLYGKRKVISDYKIPTVIKTITKKEDPKRKLYIGGNLFGDKNALQLITPGLIYKDKKDKIYQANLGVNFDGSLTYGFGMYYKIKLK